MDENEDLSFFYSILPTVKSLTSDQKFSFGIHTMQSFPNIKNKISINPSINSSSNTQLPLNTTLAAAAAATSFQPLSHTLKTRSSIVNIMSCVILLRIFSR